MEYSVILNLTQHNATPEQIKAGVVDLPLQYQEKLKKLLTFNELPDCNKIQKRAEAVGDLVEEFLTDDLSPIKDEVKAIMELEEDKRIDEFKKLKLAFMIGGAPYLMSALEEELSYFGIPLYAFTKRVVEEVVKEDGSVEKKAVFKHEGFVPTC